MIDSTYLPTSQVQGQSTALSNSPTDSNKTKNKPSAFLPRLFKSPAPGCIHTLLISKHLQLGQMACVSTPKPAVELPTTLLCITSSFCPNPLDAFKATRLPHDVSGAALALALPAELRKLS